MMSVFFRLQHTLNIFFNNCKWRLGGGLGVNLGNISENTTLKKLSLIRGKSLGFYRLLLKRKFISFSLRKTFSLNLLLKSNFKRCLRSQTQKMSLLARDLFILMDSEFVSEAASH